jgi:hypothetical protein
MEKVNTEWNRTRQWLPALVPLLMALACYIAFRTPRTVVNEFIVFFAGNDFFLSLSSQLSQWLIPLRDINGWLPSFLWVLSLALWARGWWLCLGRIQFPLVFAPALLNALWEAVQTLHLSDGDGNWNDVSAGIAASLIVFCWDSMRRRGEKVLPRLCWRHSFIALIGWAIIYLGDVRVP